MKHRQHKLRYMVLGMLCFNLLVGNVVTYGAQMNKTQVEVTQEVSSSQSDKVNSDTQEGSLEDKVAQEKQSSQGGRHDKISKSGKQKEDTDPIQIYLTLVALFGIGSCTAVLSSILYKLYVSRKVVALPVLYYGDSRKEGLYE